MEEQSRWFLVLTEIVLGNTINFYFSVLFRIRFKRLQALEIHDSEFVFPYLLDISQISFAHMIFLVLNYALKNTDAMQRPFVGVPV